MDEKLVSLLNTYGGQDKNLGQIIKDMYEHIDKKQMVVPVLGMQGMGKSTLINGILGKNILPNDADETTCVPVEVQYGEKEYAEVHFKNNRKPEIVHSRDELNAYVDNNENPANKKQVSKIILFDSLELLKSGLIIVDLPGVGSLTTENAETTHEYIKNLCTAIFVIPTTPTIRKQEVVFIKSVWSQFPTAIFVQNHWDENAREVKESVEYNTLMLKKVAKELNVEFNDDIIVVNAYNALAGKLKNDDKLINDSNQPVLVNTLNELSAEWTDQLEKDIHSRLVGAIRFSIANIENRIKEMELSQEALIEKRTEELNEFSKQSAAIREQISNVEDYLDNKESEIRRKAKKVAEDCASNIRKDVFQLIDKGVTDGDQLRDAFNHYQEDYVPAAFDTMFDDFMQIKLELEGMLDVIADMSIENNMDYQNESFDKKSQFKFEKSFGPIASIGAGIGGFFAGEAIAGIAALGSLGGPLGIAAALGITAVGVAIGSIGKKLVGKGRSNKTKSEIEPEISKIQEKVNSSILDGFNSVHNNVSAVLKNLKAERKEVERKMQEDIFKKYDNNSDAVKEKMQSDLQYLSEVVKEM